MNSIEEFMDLDTYKWTIAFREVIENLDWKESKVRMYDGYDLIVKYRKISDYYLVAIIDIDDNLTKFNINYQTEGIVFKFVRNLELEMTMKAICLFQWSEKFIFLTLAECLILIRMVYEGTIKIRS